MITRNFTLYLNAGHTVPLVINVNQYDVGEQWVFSLINGNGVKYTPSTGAIVGIKSDGLGIINSGSVNADGDVVINETKQMTAAVGKNTYELLIDDQTHGTANFIVLVEPKPGDQADFSESDLSLLQQAIDGTSAAAIAQGVSDWMDDNMTGTSPAVDSSLTVSGAAADAKKVGDEIGDLKSQIDDIEEQIGEGVDGLTSAIKSALLQLAEKVGYENSADGNTVYNDLYDALYPTIVYTAITLNKSSLSFGSLNTTQTLVATTTPRGGNVTWSSSNTSVATVSQTGVVTSVGYGNATITATCGSVSATCSVAVAQATVTSISAVYTQSGTVYNDDLIDDLKDDLVVTAHWSNGTSSTVAKTDYTLSGTLTAGTSTITVSYGGKTTTFNVSVTQSVITGWYYPFNGSLLSAGTKDFGFTGIANYANGFDSRQAYLHHVGTEGDNTTDTPAIKATGLSEYPNMSGDFTMSFWHKSFTNLKGHPVAMSKYLGDTVFTAGPVSASSSEGHGWTISHNSKSSKKYCGVTWWWYNDQLIIGIQNAAATTGNQLKLTPPSGFSTLTWHHYALTRSGNNMYFFVDGVKQATMTVSGALYSADQINVGSLFKQTAAEATDVNAMANGDVVQDLYIAETCKWTDDFDPTAIVYRDE